MKNKTLRFSSVIVMLILLDLLSVRICAQSIKRDCISSYGSVVFVDNTSINQTAGQCYNTSSLSNNKTNVLQGFQQPNTLQIQEIKSSLLTELYVSVFPNPANFSISITCEKEIPQSYIRVTDISGNIIYNAEIMNLLSHNINCESWANGIYLVTISDSSENSKTVRLIISK